MRVYEAKIEFKLVHLGEAETINNAEHAVKYLQSAIDTHSVQEGFYVILLDRKNHPLGRVLVSIFECCAECAVSASQRPRAC